METRVTDRIRVRNKEGKIIGPFTRSEVLALIHRKKIEGEEEIFFESEGKWRPIASDTEFFDFLQEVQFGVKSGTQATAASGSKIKSESRGTWTNSFDKNPYPRVDQTEKISDEVREGTINTFTAPAKFTPHALHPSERSVISHIRPGQSKEEAAGVRSFADLETTPKPKAPAKKNFGLVLLLSVLSLGIFSYWWFSDQKSVDFSTIRYEFPLAKGYFRPLSLRLKLLTNLEHVPQNLKANFEQVKFLPLNVHHILLLLDEVEAQPDARSNASTWILRAWSLEILGDAVAAGLPTKGQELKRAGTSLLREINKSIKIPDEISQTFAALNVFMAGDWPKAMADLTKPSEKMLAARVLKREISYWGTLNGKAKMESSALGEDDVSDLPARLQLEEHLRIAATLGVRDEFLQAADNLLSLDSHSLLAWFLLSEFYENNFKTNPQVANRFYFTGLSELALSLRTLQIFYWNQYGAFLGKIANASAPRMLQAAELISKGGYDTSAAAMDIDDPSLHFSGLLETYKRAFEQNEMNNVELASFEVLSEASPNARANLVQVLMAPMLDKNWPVAEQRLRLLERTFPFDPEVKILRVWYEGERFQFEKASTVLNTSFNGNGGATKEALKAEGLLRIVGRDYDAGIDLLKKYLEADPQDALSLYFLARAGYEGENYIDCVKNSQLAQLNSLGPMKMHALILNYRCRVKANLGVNAALQEFAQFVEKFPSTAVAREEYIRALLDADQSQEALKIAQDLVIRNPASGGLKILLGEVLEKRGQKNEALLMYNEARKLEPTKPRSALHIANLFYNENRFKEAAQNYVAAGAQDVELPEVFLRAARAFAKSGQKDRAREMYFKEVELRPAVIETFLEAATSFLESNEPAQVPELFKRFDQNFGSDPRILTRLAQAYFALGDRKSARTNAELAIRTNSSEPEPYRILGNIFELEGQFQSARANYEKYLILLPQAYDAEELRRKIAVPPFSVQ